MLKILAVVSVMLGRVIVASAQQPASCNIEGKVLSIVKEHIKDKKQLCAKHPCLAHVQVMRFSDCGSGIIAANGDTILLRFNYTLDNTKKLFPKMKLVYPGLKKGNIFTGRVEQYLRPGNNVEWVINDYHLK